jgi:uncharacterized protein YjdB
MRDAMEATGISYRSHVEGLGFLGAVSNGTTSGSFGRRTEGVQIWSETPGVRPCYTAHVQGEGWQAPFCDGELAGTVGQGKRMEAIQIRLNQKGPFNKIMYRARVEGTWQAFTASDQTCSSGSTCPTNLCFNGRCAAGTTGQGKKIDALEMQIL